MYVSAAMTFDAGHGLRSGAVWGEGLVCDLPEVDYIQFISSDHEEQFAVPFSVVVDVVGLVPNSAVFPRRYRVSGWPQPAIMDALRFHAVAAAPS